MIAPGNALHVLSLEAFGEKPTSQLMPTCDTDVEQVGIVHGQVHYPVHGGQ